MALLLGAVSCTDLLDEALRGRGDMRDRTSEIDEFPDGARVSLGFNVPMPVATKTMTDHANPQINTIHVFVFVDNGQTDNGVLFEVQKAELGGYVDKNAQLTYNTTDSTSTITNQDAQTVLARWKVDLLMSRTKRRLHFVANLPESFEIPEAGTAEFSVMQSIQTSGDEVAYWQMVELEHGVLAYTYDGTGSFSFVNDQGVKETKSVKEAGVVDGWQSYDSTTGTYHYRDKDGTVIDVAKGDYIATTGHKVLDGKGFYASEELSNTVSMIPLVRNIARIRVMTDGTGNFQLTKAVLINTPEKGFAAPFDDASHKFVEAYRNAARVALSHATILESGYPASIPAHSIDTDLPADTAPVTATVSGNQRSAMLYMYERGIPTENATALLVCGTLNGVENRWLKIEIAQEDGSYFPIYRDFTYDIKIKSINGSNGYGDMEEAYNNPAIGDISSSPETATLTQINDGKGLTLWVEYIDKTSTSPDGETVTILYKFYDTSTNPDTDYTEHVKLTVKPVSGREAAINSEEEELAGSPYTGTDPTPDGDSGWYQANVPLAGAGGETKISTLHVAGTKPGGKTLYRDVTFRVMKKQNFTTLSATPLASENAGENTTLTIELPQYLGYSVFPLTLMIKAEAGNLNPGDGENLSVESGNKSFYFLKTINYSEYQANRVFTVDLKTTKDGSSVTNATTIYVKDKGGYFNTGDTPLTVLPVGITPVEQTVKGSASSATFKIVNNLAGVSNFSWQISDVTGGASFPSTSGTEAGEITMNFDAIEDPAATGKEYTAQFSYSYTLDGVSYSETVPLTVHQSALKLVSRTETVSKSFTLSNVAGISISDDNGDGTSVTMTHGNGISFYHSNYSGDWFTSTSSNNLTLIFTPSSSIITITKVSLDWNDYDYRPGSITISGGASGTIPIVNNATIGSWEGTSDSPLTASMTRRGNSNFRFKTITVDYKYTMIYYE